MSGSVGYSCVPLPASLPARIIPAEHTATDTICLHQSRLLRTGEVCRRQRCDAEAAESFQPPNPCDPAAFPGTFGIPSPSGQPPSPRLTASSRSRGVVLNGITVCRGLSAGQGNLPAPEVQAKSQSKLGYGVLRLAECISRLCGIV